MSNLSKKFIATDSEEEHDEEEYGTKKVKKVKVEVKTEVKQEEDNTVPSSPMKDSTVSSSPVKATELDSKDKDGRSYFNVVYF